LPFLILNRCKSIEKLEEKKEAGNHLVIREYGLVVLGGLFFGTGFAKLLAITGLKFRRQKREANNIMNFILRAMKTTGFRLFATMITLAAVITATSVPADAQRRSLQQENTRS